MINPFKSYWFWSLAVLLGLLTFLYANRIVDTKSMQAKTQIREYVVALEQF